MTLAQQAVVIWSLLSMAARMQRVPTSGEIEDYSGILARAQGEPLHLTFLYCERKGYPQLNSIAVNRRLPRGPTITGKNGGRVSMPSSLSRRAIVPECTPVGLEPTTSCLEGRYSIQLSYGVVESRLANSQDVGKPSDLYFIVKR